MSTVRLMLHERRPLTALHVDYQGFILDREAARCTPTTIAFYTYTVGSFVACLQEQGIKSPSQITAHHIRAYLVSLQRRGFVHFLLASLDNVARFWYNIPVG